MRRYALTLIVLSIFGGQALAGQGASDKGQPPGKSAPAPQAAAQHGKPDTGEHAANGYGEKSKQASDGGHGNEAASDNHGQAVSDCNHQANERSLKGQERHDFVEWCTSRGYRYEASHTPRYWDADRSCYSRAAERGLTGEKRADFLRSCLGSEGGRVARDGKCIPGEPRGRDVLGKGCTD